MKISVWVNQKKIEEEIACDLLLIDFLRSHGCASVKRGCETSNCGLCTVMMNGKPILSCSVLAARADGHRIETLEGLREEAEEFGAFIAGSGSGAVWILQSGSDDERHCPVSGISGSGRRDDQRISVRKFVPLFRL